MLVKVCWQTTSLTSLVVKIKERLTRKRVSPFSNIDVGIVAKYLDPILHCKFMYVAIPVSDHTNAIFAAIDLPQRAI